MEALRFITFLYADEDGNRKIYHADFPSEFIWDFKGAIVTELGGC